MRANTVYESIFDLQCNMNSKSKTIPTNGTQDERILLEIKMKSQLKFLIVDAIYLCDTINFPKCF